MNIKSWIQGACFRTLPLSVSGILVGCAYANYQHKFDWTIFVLALFKYLVLSSIIEFYQ